MDFADIFLGTPPNLEHCLRIGWRLIAAGLAGALIGYQRERTGKAAGLRTHILIAMGTAMFMLGAAEVEMTSADLSRVIQGLAAGVGFLGAGSIIKRHDSAEIHGLTTAAGIWMTAAVSIVISMGFIVQGFIGAVLGWAVLTLLRKLPAEAQNNNQ